jgi:acyl-CoA thioesterase I
MIRRRCEAMSTAMTSLGRTLLIVTAMLATACSQADSAATSADATRASGPRTPPAAPSQDTAPRIVILGDSLTAGLGLDPSQSFPSLLQDRLDAAGLNYQVVNAGVSGDTTAGGLRRLEWSVEGDTRVLVVALGGNDGLRGLPVEETRRNLDAIITRAEERDITVILAGMEAPPNYGPEYTAEFRRVFSDLAKEHDVAFIPFLLDGVAGDPALNQRDGIHPNPEGARIVERLVWRAVEPALAQAPAR